MKIKRYIPNILSFGNMGFGIAAIALLFGLDTPRVHTAAAGLVTLGGVLDFFDGYLARKWNFVTKFGKKLDSAADFLTFGIAPVVLINRVDNCGHLTIVLIASMLFLCAGAYRLARHNKSRRSDHFLGLPITISGVLLSIYCAVLPRWMVGQSLFFTVVTVVFVAVLSAAMVSRVRIKRVV